MAASPLYSLIFITALFVISNKAQANSSPENNSQQVTVENASSLLFYPERKATALIKPINHAQVPAQISAQVLNVMVELGDIVNKDQVLVSLNCEDKSIYLAKQESQLTVSKAQLNLAKRNFDRAVKLKQNRHIGDAELDSSKVEVTIAKENLAQVIQEKKSANLAVERCKVLSPFDGVVTERMVSEGNYVSIGQSLVKVLENNNIEVEAQIPLNLMNNFLQAEQYHFINDSKKHPIHIKNVVDFIASNSRSQIVTFSVGNIDNVNNINKVGVVPVKKVSNTSKSILAGMNGMVSWQSKRSFFPSHLLTQRKGQYGIFVAEKDKGLTLAKFIKLPNAQEGRPFELTLAINQQIIVDGRHRVSAGSFVKINNTDK
jgi:RND family efflux transporter MFP subunit